jgi:hypothetical protein
MRERLREARNIPISSLVSDLLMPRNSDELGACGAGLHPAGRFPTGLFMLSSPSQERR